MDYDYYYCFSNFSSSFFLHFMISSHFPLSSACIYDRVISLDPSQCLFLCQNENDLHKTIKFYFMALDVDAKKQNLLHFFIQHQINEELVHSSFHFSILAFYTLPSLIHFISNIFTGIDTVLWYIYIYHLSIELASLAATFIVVVGH